MFVAIEGIPVLRHGKRTRLIDEERDGIQSSREGRIDCALQNLSSEMSFRPPAFHRLRHHIEVFLADRSQHERFGYAVILERHIIYDPDLHTHP